MSANNHVKFVRSAHPTASELRSFAAVYAKRYTAMKRLTCCLTIVSLTLMLRSVHGASVNDAPVQLTITNSLPSKRFQIRLASPIAREQYAQGSWHILANQDSLNMFVSEKVFVDGSNVMGLSITDTCKGNLRNNGYGISVLFQPAAWESVRQFTVDHMNELVAVMVGGKIVSVARIQGVFDRRLAVCAAADTEVDAHRLAKEIVGEELYNNAFKADVARATRP